MGEARELNEASWTLPFWFDGSIPVQPPQVGLGRHLTILFELLHHPRKPPLIRTIIDLLFQILQFSDDRFGFIYIFFKNLRYVFTVDETQVRQFLYSLLEDVSFLLHLIGHGIS